MNTLTATNRNQTSGPRSHPSRSAPAVTTVAGYLLARLAEAGVISIFGVPGDDNLGVRDAIAARPSLAWIGMATEPGAAYAAASYARLRGLGAVVTTYGVGELSAMNAIEGAYAESVPVVHIVGTPALSARKPGTTVHHNLPGTEYRQYACLAAEVTAAQADLRPDTAPEQIDRVLGTALRTSRPVYLALPADVAAAPVQVQVGRLDPGPTGRLAQARAIPTGKARSVPPQTDLDLEGRADRGGSLTQGRLWASVQHFLLPGDLLLSDQGAAANLTTPEGAQLIGPPPFASIGWTVPAALGVSLAAPDRRVIVVIGDGALRQTLRELDSLLAQGTVPVIIVLNQDGDPVDRARHAVTLRAASPDEFASALCAASYHTAAGRPVLVDAVLAGDAPPWRAELAGAPAGRDPLP